ncbi:molybdenum cofactor guanylyltransferase [Pendulispora albinea]|uniref:Molybdenum cofactor guanylyltransferase n=1 Tax=Pendulispora albinea TaxID=2741071 RepID=A0ABZ2M172_9BACT
MTAGARRRPVLGIFVGGRARRMGGFPKGLLPVSASGETIVERMVRLAHACDLEAALVGDAASYAGVAPHVVVLADSPAGIGPLGGLAALLAHARREPALAVACDMPFVTEALVTRLRDAPMSAPIVAARRTPDGPFEPFLARYDTARVEPVLAERIGAGVRSFQQLFAACGAAEWPLAPEEQAAWNDWDTPEDLPDWARR